MEKHGNKTVMCSVLFLDIAEYSKKSVAGQILLKERFNGYLAKAISDVPTADRIILDTGDGAAINFLGDVEDALKTALSMRESMLDEDTQLSPPLLVRMGINHGPVRLVRDINGQPNIVGDGINVAQRVMGFAEASQILVSRSYFDAVSRISPTYAGMFHYQGSRTDKHVREHELYAIGYPGDKIARPELTDNFPEPHATASLPVKSGASATWLVERLKQSYSRQRALYIGALVLALALVGILLFKMLSHDRSPAVPGDAGKVNEIQPISAVASVVPAGEITDSKKAATGKTVVKPDAKAESTHPRKDTAIKAADDKSPGQAASPVAQTAVKLDTKTLVESSRTRKDTAIKAADGKNQGLASGSTVQPADAYISIICKEEAKLFVDGAEKGKVPPTGLTVTIPPGKHEIIVASKSGSLYTQNVDAEAGKTVSVKPVFCKQ